MTSQELQQEELEVLRSIYEGDTNFKEINENTFQYKIGEDGKSRSFVLEISWGENYPDAVPALNLEAFYNKHLLKDVKECVISRLLQEAEQFLGTAATFTLLEWAKENAETLLSDQPEEMVQAKDLVTNLDSLQIEEANEVTSQKKEKKVQLTKAQKRRLYDRFDATGERPRGWDWIDVVKHLSQTGSKDALADS